MRPFRSSAASDRPFARAMSSGVRPLGFTLPSVHKACTGRSKAKRRAAVSYERLRRASR